ncbi:hypothetical protein ABW20_dc0107340 [Dactylellina cionopaga]|nr:hypothetical protein ABW20_dc0107340 [Dactylellina cionopaga]
MLSVGKAAAEICDLPFTIMLSDYEKARLRESVLGGCSGGAGKFSRATRTIGVGVGVFLKRLSGWCSAQGCIPMQFKDDIERLDPFAYLPDLVYGGFAGEWSDRELGAELDFVTRSVQNSEKLHVSSCTETEWVMHTKAILEHAFKSYESSVSVLVATTIDLEPSLLPIDLGRLSAPPRLQTSTSKPRKNSVSSGTESDTGQYDTTSAKVDIAVGLDKTDPIVADFLKELEATCRTRAPTAFTNSIPFPIIPIKVKDESGSSLAAEYETTLCASAMLASWSSASATTAPATLQPVNLNSSMMQTEDLAPTEVLDEDITTEVKPSPLVLTLSVIGANWYYNVVYTDDIRDFTCTRQVLGPFLVGQSRNFQGTFQILRFLRMACEWGVKEWVKDMCEKLGDNEGVNRGLARLMEDMADHFSEAIETKEDPDIAPQSTAITKTASDGSLHYADECSSLFKNSNELASKSAPTSDDCEPTTEEKNALRHVAENLPLSAWLVAVVELCERFSYYGCQGLFQNFIQRPYDGREGPGALGLGQHGATGLGTFFQFWCYVTPIFGAIVADQYLGKYKTIVYFCMIYIAGLIVLFVSSLPFSLKAGNGLGGFICAIILIGLGTGGIKANVSPLIAEQYTRKRMVIKTLPSGERVILDPALTIQRIYMVFYLSVNIGSLSVLATPYMEYKLAWSFSSAYLLCLCMFLVGLIVLVLGRKKYVVRPPKGSIITNAFKAAWIMIKNRNTDAPKPSWQAERSGGLANLPWDDYFIEELKRSLVACKVFTIFPIFWVVYNQFSTNFVSQAGQMQTHGIPNDLMQNFDPIAIIFFVPILDRIIYPLLQKTRIPFPPVNRIALGFTVASLGMAYAAIVQHLIYSSGPCYKSPLCPASEVNGVAQGNNIHIAVQAPAYVLIGLAEILASVTGLEYAYMKAPTSMRSFVQAIFLLTYAFGAAISEALSPTARDPTILWMYVGISIAAFIAGWSFWAFFNGLNDIEDELNELEEPEENESNERRVENLDKS